MAGLGIPTAVPWTVVLDTVLPTGVQQLEESHLNVGDKGWSMVDMERRGEVLVPTRCFEIVR